MRINHECQISKGGREYVSTESAQFLSFSFQSLSFQKRKIWNEGRRKYAEHEPQEYYGGMESEPKRRTILK